MPILSDAFKEAPLLPERSLPLLTSDTTVTCQQTGSGCLCCCSQSADTHLLRDAILKRWAAYAKAYEENQCLQTPAAASSTHGPPSPYRPAGQGLGVRGCWLGKVLSLGLACFITIITSTFPQFPPSSKASFDVHFVSCTQGSLEYRIITRMKGV